MVLVRAQHGVVTLRQLRAAGVGEGAVRHRVRAGRLRPVHRGVFAVGPLELTESGRLMAAVLACGAGAVLSHLSAATLWGLRGRAPTRVDVTVPTRAGRKRRPGISVHRASLTETEVARRDGIPVTTPTRTLLDIASKLGRRELERAVDEADRLRLLNLPATLAALRAKPGRRGAAGLRAVLRTHEVGSTLTRSPLEEAFLALCDEQGLPRPEVNVRLGHDTVDFLWRDSWLVAETDGEGSHRTRFAFEEDRARDARLAVAGYRVVRFTTRRVREDPDGVAGAVRALLAGASKGA